MKSGNRQQRACFGAWGHQDRCNRPTSYRKTTTARISRTLVLGLVAILVLGGLVIPSVSAAESYGAESNPTGNPVGGGAGYSDIYTQNDPRVDYVVRTLAEFRTALSSARAGDVIFIPKDVTIDTSSVQTGLTIPGGVTVASDRGYNGSPGGRIYHPRKSGWSTSSHAVALKAGGNNARLTGVRLEGSDTQTSPRLQPMSGGITSNGYRIIVDNCEISGFEYFGVMASSGASNYGYVHHNYIHHCQADGYGYGVVNSGTTLIEANRFKYTRHCIADSGSTSHFYEARYNIVEPPNTAHNFDMHGEGNTYCGSMYVHHNTFKDTSQPAVRFRAVPIKTGYVDHNWYWKTNAPSVQQKNGNGNIVNEYNVVGSAKTLCTSCPIALVSTSAYPVPSKTSIAKTARTAMLAPLTPYPTSTAQPTPTPTPTTTPTPTVTPTPGTSGTTVWIEAESLALTSPMVKASDAAASGGAYIWAPQGNGDQVATGTRGTATYTLDVPASGSYTLWARASSPTAGDDSFWFSMDVSTPRHWDFTSNANWHWEKGTAYTLSAGKHTITLKWREDGTKIDKLLLTADATLTPSGTGGTTNPTPTASALKVDMGISGQAVQTGYTAWSNAAQLNFGAFGGFTGIITQADGSSAVDWRDRGTVSGSTADLIKDGAKHPRGLQLTFKNLRAGTYRITLYHHDASNVQGTMDIYLTDADSTNRLIANEVKVTTGQSDTNVASTTAQFRSSGNDVVFRMPVGDSGWPYESWVNGFELEQIP